MDQRDQVGTVKSLNDVLRTFINYYERNPVPCGEESGIVARDIACRVPETKNAPLRTARLGWARLKGGVTTSVEALQHGQSGDACPDHAAEADGQP
jgi:hypothetical protein